MDTPSVVGNLASPSAVRAVGDGARHRPPRSPRPATSSSTRSANRCRPTRRRSQRVRLHQPLQLQPGQTRSLVHFVVTGLSETTTPDIPPAKAGTSPAPAARPRRSKRWRAELAADAGPERPQHRPALLDRELDRSVDQSGQTGLHRGRMREQSDHQRPGPGGRTAGTDDELALRRGRQIDHRRDRRDGETAKPPPPRSPRPTSTGSPPTTTARSGSTR